MQTLSILVKGQVQGIGFRPFVYNLAKRLNIKGIVKNTKQGVLILCQGKNTKKFLNFIKTSPPRLAKIDNIIVKLINAKQYNDFSIIGSERKNKKYNNAVQIIPDLTICQECIGDILDPKNRRFYYPFTNCTQCGPRYSIILDTPYDRPQTTMRDFKMCSDCENEYKNPKNRRFHAQPNACHICGPYITLNPITELAGSGKEPAKKVIENAVFLLKQGKILAIKSIGGFLLAIDAQNERAVQKLRKKKNRSKKPFALMCKDIKTIKQLCEVNKQEEELLTSNIAPIVLLKKRTKPKLKIAKSIAPNNHYLGIMLPYTPLHKLLFETTPEINPNVSHETSKADKSIEDYCGAKRKAQCSLKVLVMTSGNPKDAPIITDAQEIKKRLSKCVDYILDHNRRIASRCDDSVLFNFNGPILIRRSRGYVPSPIILQDIKLKPVLAFGSDLKNYFALAYGHKVYLSPYIGDLGSKETIDFFGEILEKYQRWFGIKPKIVACDLHPDYISRRMAEDYSNAQKIPLVKTQHHYAHIVSVIAEHNLKPPVIGLSFDGTGYGEDGNIWGSEFMLVDYHSYKRIAHLRYLPLIGADSAITNPKKIAIAYIKELNLSQTKSSALGFNRIYTSSMGRLFDAVAHLLGSCTIQTFEGEAPISLEAEALKFETGTKHREKLNLKLIGESISIVTDTLNKNNALIENYIIEPKPILELLINLRKRGGDVTKLSWLFHQWVIQISIAVVKKIAEQTQIYTICLAGGVFQNQIVLKGISERLNKSGFKVYFNRAVPINDGGIALGQAVVAGKKN